MQVATIEEAYALGKSIAEEALGGRFTGDDWIRTYVRIERATVKACGFQPGFDMIFTTHGAEEIV